MAKAKTTTLSVQNAEIALATLPPDRSSAFELNYLPEALEDLRQELGLLKLEKMRVTALLEPQGKSGWRLSGQFGATVTQPCVVTLEPVKTRLDLDFERLYLADYTTPSEGDEFEMPPDTDTESLPETLPLAQIAAEILALNLPDYPRKSDAALAAQNFAPPGVDPLTDEDVNPFAKLAEIKDKLKK